MKHTTKPGVMVYFELRNTLDRLSLHDAGILFRAIMSYGETGEIPELPENIYLFWPLVQMRLDADDRKYRSVIHQRQYATYCRKEKAAGNTPMEYNVWLAELDEDDF